MLKLADPQAPLSQPTDQPEIVQELENGEFRDQAKAPG